MSTYHLRQRLLRLARFDVGQVEDTKNQAIWIKKLWPATTYGIEGYHDRAPYCAAGVAYVVKEWLLDEDVRAALGLTLPQAEKWRCKAASVKNDPDDNWLSWAAAAKGVEILHRNCILHAGDLVIYMYSHIEIVTNDDGTETGPFVAIGYNTNAAGSRDGEGCFEKPRSRDRVQCFIRLLQ